MPSLSRIMHKHLRTSEQALYAQHNTTQHNTHAMLCVWAIVARRFLNVKVLSWDENKHKLRVIKITFIKGVTCLSFMGLPNCLPSCASNLSHISSWRPQTEIRLHCFLFLYAFSFINTSHSRAWLSPPSPCFLRLRLHPLHQFHVRTKRRKKLPSNCCFETGLPKQLFAVSVLLLSLFCFALF